MKILVYQTFLSVLESCRQKLLELNQVAGVDFVLISHLHELSDHIDQVTDQLLVTGSVALTSVEEAQILAELRSKNPCLIIAGYAKNGLLTQVDYEIPWGGATDGFKDAVAEYLRGNIQQLSRSGLTREPVSAPS